MANSKSAPTAEKYGDVVRRLEDVVKRLEGGELALEDSLKAFEEGIGLVRRGETLLTDAEKRIEQLLSEDGQDRAVPLELASSRQDRAPAPAAASEVEEEDIPF